MNATHSASMVSAVYLLRFRSLFNIRRLMMMTLLGGEAAVVLGGQGRHDAALIAVNGSPTRPLSIAKRRTPEVVMFWGDGYMIGMHLGWWLFWVGVIVAIVLLLRGGAQRDDRPRETPHEALRRRLANGELSPQEYEERKALLDRDSPAGGAATR
jgi:putative membrane protein